MTSPSHIWSTLSIILRIGTAIPVRAIPMPTPQKIRPEISDLPALARPIRTNETPKTFNKPLVSPVINLQKCHKEIVWEEAIAAVESIQTIKLIL